MELHPHPEPYTTVVVKERRTVARCPVMTTFGEQCRKSLHEGAYNRIIDGRIVKVCSTHRDAK